MHKTTVIHVKMQWRTQRRWVVSTVSIVNNWGYSNANDNNTTLFEIETTP